MEHKKTKIVIFAIGCSSVCVPAVFGMVVGFGTNMHPIQNYTGSFGKWSDVKSDDWMAHIDPTTPISMISIPGSHDSLTQYVKIAGGWGNAGAFMACTTNYNLTDQLNGGVRIFDLRPAIDRTTGKLYSHHDVADCIDKDGNRYTFDKWVSECFSFFKKHPNETVLVHMFDEGQQDPAVKQAIKDLINQNPSRWWTSNEIPTLSDAKGKIILLNRYSEDIDDNGINVFKWRGEPEDKKHNNMYSTTLMSEGGDNWFNSRLFHHRIVFR